MILRIDENEIDDFKRNLLLFLTHHEFRHLLYPIDSFSLTDDFPIKLGGSDIEIDNVYFAHSI